MLTCARDCRFYASTSGGTDSAGEVLEEVRIDNDPLRLAAEIASTVSWKPHRASGCYTA